MDNSGQRFVNKYTYFYVPKEYKYTNESIFTLVRYTKRGGGILSTIFIKIRLICVYME